MYGCMNEGYATISFKNLLCKEMHAAALTALALKRIFFLPTEALSFYSSHNVSQRHHAHVHTRARARIDRHTHAHTQDQMPCAPKLES